VTFYAGFMAGVATMAAGLQCLFGFLVVPGLRRLYVDFPAAVLPRATAAALDPRFLWGTPAAVMALWVVLALLFSRMPTVRAVVLTIIAVAALGAVVVTVWAGYLPLVQLAGNVRAE
jgi:hypothetical protein